jgi:thiamine pyrophosphate-dependent acetolactate synthase large subunit-like protein
VDVNATEAVAAALEAVRSDSLVVASLGTATSALRAASDDGPHFYMGGAMGCGLGIALGIADGVPDRSVLAVIGDGDLIMGASSLFSLSGLAPANLLVLILDDGRYTITGGQSVVAPEALAAVADALPGVEVAVAAGPAEVGAALGSSARPGVVLAQIDDGEWPGPSPFVEPHEVLRRFALAVDGQAS